MKIFAPLVCLLVIAFEAAPARIGETRAQCEARYGESEKSPDSPDALFFRKGGFMIMINFFNDRADTIVFRKVTRTALGGGEALSENEIANFLEANGGGLEWKPTNEISFVDRSWITADGGIAANYQTMKGALVLITKESSLRASAAQKAKETSAQEGF